MKKGQFTVFIILGLVLFIIVAFIILNLSLQEDTPEIEVLDFSSIEFYLSSCYNELLASSITKLKSKKIYEGEITLFNGEEIPLLVLEDNNKVILDLEERLKEIVFEKKEMYCDIEIETFELQGFEVDLFQDIIFEINLEGVYAEFLDTKIFFQDIELEKDFNFNTPSIILTLHNFLLDYSEEESALYDGFNLGQLFILSALYDFTYEIFHVEDKRVLIDLYEEDELITTFGVIYR